MGESSTRREILLGEVRNNLIIPEYLCGFQDLRGLKKWESGVFHGHGGTGKGRTASHCPRAGIDGILGCFKSILMAKQWKEHVGNN